MEKVELGKEKVELGKEGVNRVKTRRDERRDKKDKKDKHVDMLDIDIGITVRTLQQRADEKQKTTQTYTHKLTRTNRT